MAYDIKYRRRAIDHLAEGNTVWSTAAIFQVSTSTIERWKSQLKETGSLAPKQRREVWRKIDPTKLKSYIKEHPDAYLRENAEEFGCSDVAILKAFRRLKITRKKKLLFTRKVMRVFDRRSLKS